MNKKIVQLEQLQEDQRLHQPPVNENLLEAVLRLQKCEEEGVMMATFIMDQVCGNILRLFISITCFVGNARQQVRNFQNLKKRWSEHSLRYCRQWRTKNPAMYEGIRRSGILNLPARNTLYYVIGQKSKSTSKNAEETESTAQEPEVSESSARVNGEADEMIMDTSVTNEIDEAQNEI